MRFYLRVSALLVFTLMGIGMISVKLWAKEVVRPMEGVSHAGEMISLSDLTLDRPIALIVIKGSTCRSCIRQIREFYAQREVVRKIGADLGVLIWEEDELLSQFEESFEQIFGEYSIYRGSREFFEALGFWDRTGWHPLQGVLLLDRCGKPYYSLIGLNSERNQKKLVMWALDFMARLPAYCGILL